MIVSQALFQITQLLTTYLRNTVNAEQEALWLLAHVLSSSTAHIRTYPNQTLTPEQQQILSELMIRRINDHEPLAYIFGNVPFAGLDLAIVPPVLIPRPETEEMVMWIIEQIKEHAPEQPLRILDLCTGSGCIALALAHHLPRCEVVGIDNNDKAMRIAQKNARACGLHNVTFVKKDVLKQDLWILKQVQDDVITRGRHPGQLFEQSSMVPDPGSNNELLPVIQHNFDDNQNASTHPVPVIPANSPREAGECPSRAPAMAMHSMHSTFNLIISNPPYITDEDYESLDPSVQKWESRDALRADDNGLIFYKTIANMAPALLAEPVAGLPSLIFEIGHTQKKAVSDILTTHHFSNTKCHKDLFSLDRWLAATLSRQ